MPIISGFAPIYYISSENKSKSSRFVLVKNNKNEYIICKMVSYELTDSFTVILGILLNKVLINVEFEINILEPFILIMTKGIYASFPPILYTMLISDFPDTKSS